MGEFLINFIASFVETVKVEIGIADSIANVVKEVGKESVEIYKELDE